MTPIQTEITALEERLRLAELGPDPQFFEDVLADQVVLVSDGGETFTKSKVVEAHRSGRGPKFTRVEMRDMAINDYGPVAVVTCQGLYENLQMSVTLKFMRVWFKKNDRWQIIAGAVSKV